MVMGEQISESINSQIGGQPESWNNGASRWVDKKFGMVDNRISAYINGEEPETLQDKVDLADLIVKTPNYLLEKSVNTRRGRDESSEEARKRVTDEVGRLFSALKLASEAHSEDVRSEKSVALSEKPQQIFDDLLQQSLELKDGKITKQLRLSAALVDSNIVRDHGLVVDESIEGRQEVILATMVHENIGRKFRQKVENTMSDFTQNWKANHGISRCGDLMRIGREVFGESFEMPQAIIDVVLQEITPTIEAEMMQYPQNWRADHGITKHAGLRLELKERMRMRMPEGAAEAVLTQVAPTIEAEMDDYPSKWKAGHGIDKWHKLEESLKTNMEADVPVEAVHLVLDQITLSVEAEMDDYPAQWQADHGIEKYGNLQGKLRNAVGRNMPELSRKCVLDRVSSTIEGVMRQYPQNWRADHGMAKFEKLARELAQKMNTSMPDSSSQVVLDQIIPTIEAEQSQYPEEWREIHGKDKAQKLLRNAISSFWENDALSAYNNALDILTKFGANAPSFEQVAQQ